MVAAIASMADRAVAAPSATKAGPVVFIGIPDLRWSDLANMPALRGLVQHAAVGQLSVKSEGQATRCGDALLELSAGTRVPSGVVGCDIDRYDYSALQARYRHSRFGARVGLLGDSLGRPNASGGAAIVLGTSAGPANPPGGVPGLVTPPQLRVLVIEGLYGAADRQQAAAAIDKELARTLAAAPANATVMVAGISDGPTGGPHLHPIVVAGPAWPHRELTSATTGRSPYVQLFDLSATLLSLSGKSVPSAMSGRAVRPSSAHVGDIASYADADRHAQRALTVGHPTFSVLCGVLIGCLLLLLFVPSLAGWPLRLLLAAPLATWLVQVVPWWRWPVLAFAAAIAIVAAVVGVAHWLVGRGSRRAALLLVPALVGLVLVVDQLVGAPLQLSAPFGDNPLVAGRFHGMGNIDFAVAMTSLLLCTAVVAASLDRRRAVLVTLAAAVVAVVVDGAPWLGDDLGGVLALVPAFAVLLAVLAGVRITSRRAFAVVAGAVALAVVAGLADYARPQSHQTHAGRFVGQVLHGGAWTVLHRKTDAVLGSFGTPLVTALVVVLVLAAVFARRRGALAEPVPGVRAAALAVAVLAVVGSLLNDSGIFVAAAAFVAFVPAVALAGLGDTRRL